MSSTRAYGGLRVERDIFKQYIQMISPNKGELHLLDWEYRAGLENAAAAVNARENASNLDRAMKENHPQEARVEISAC